MLLSLHQPNFQQRNRHHQRSRFLLNLRLNQPRFTAQSLTVIPCPETVPKGADLALKIDARNVVFRLLEMR
jgi:hypothetical protein